MSYARTYAPHPPIDGVAYLGPPLGAWDPKTYAKDDLVAYLPIPRDRFLFVGALFGATITAVTGRTDAKSILVGATAGVIGVVTAFIVTGRD